ncbi:MAG: MFS transporter [Acidobacteriota bacterium]|nr:MFS transporter [Acidobacteriota bacterium]
MAEAAIRPRVTPATTNVLALLCAMYFINYIVRVNVSTAAAAFQPELHLTNTQVGLIFSAFAYPYLAFQIAGGWVADKFGARRALTVFAIIWSSATVLMGLAHSLSGMILGRVLLGGGVSALPVATRAMSNWTPAEQRGFAQGITHAFARLGNALTPPLVAWLILLVSWRGSFVVIGTVSFVWAAAWGIYFRDDPAEHPGITADDLKRLPTQPTKTARRVPFARLAARMLPVTLVYFCYGWTLWFFLAWIPSYFLHSYQLKLSSSALFASGVFLGGTCGDFLGGILTDRIFERTHSRTKARRNMIIFGFLASTAFMLPVLVVHSLPLIALTLSLAFFFAELTVGAFWAIPMDIAPRYSGFASGFMNSGSALAAIVSPLIGGYIVDKTGRWEMTFVAGIALLLLGAALAFWMKPDEELEDPTDARAVAPTPTSPSTAAGVSPGTR